MDRLDDTSFCYIPFSYEVTLLGGFNKRSSWLSSILLSFGWHVPKRHCSFLVVAICRVAFAHSILADRNEKKA